MCTRFPEAIPLKDIHTSTVAEALLEIFSGIGLPNKIHSDRGSQFTSDMMREVYRLLYLLMALKKVTELLPLWSIETTLNVFDYLMQQASLELNYMPFCLR